MAETKNMDSLSNPKEESGIIGEFCEMYSVPDAIEQFCSGKLTRSQEQEKGGALIYSLLDNKNDCFLVSDDGSTCFRFCNDESSDGEEEYINAFDFVRLINYGALDKDIDKDTSKDTWPSFLAMEELINQDDKILKYRWQSTLETKDNKIKNTLENYIIIFQNDRRFANIRYNELMQTLVKVSRFDWDAPRTSVKQDMGSIFTQEDYDRINRAISKDYGLSNSRLVRVALRTAYYDESWRINPIVDYYDRVDGTWDGKHRVEQLLQNYFGLPDTAYARFLSKAIIMGIIARQLATGEGVQFDIVPILYGTQGIGKTSFCRELIIPGYYSCVTSINSKDISGELGYGICELAEAEIFRSKSNLEKIKAFTTQTFDRYRVVYQEQHTLFVRHCIFIMTTNNKEGLLKDKTGNRRFWPVMCAKPYVPGTIDEQTRNQLFAEGLALYHAGDFEQYLFSRDENILAEADRFCKQFEEHTEIADVIADYIDKTGTDSLCAKELYIKAFQMPPSNYYRDGQMQIRIRNALKTLPGWQADEQRMRNYKNYGRQLVFRYKGN